MFNPWPNPALLAHVEPIGFDHEIVFVELGLAADDDGLAFFQAEELAGVDAHSK